MRNKLVKTILTLAHKKKEGHIGSSLSILDILYVLYDKFIKNTDNKFILSKGHASLGLYVVLDYFNLLKCDINSFCDFNSELGGHPCNKTESVETSTGSLGHGLPIAVGMAMGYKIQSKDSKVFVLIGDGEANEGSIWESALLASHHKLNNLYCILDHNKSGDRAVKIDNVKQKFKSFNWECLEVDGHNQEELIVALSHKSQEKPIFILANTIKGKGIKVMENNPEWHHKSPTVDELNLFIGEINQ
jgi:transketolase